MSPTADLLAGRYRLGRLLGQGGMSDVHEAFDEDSQATVAVKLVRLGDPSLGPRLAQEARALEGLDHPGLVRLLDAGMAGARAYLVMELVNGTTLSAELRDGALTPERTAALGARLADALAYVHVQGIVHRDVKPSNVLVTPAGDPRLADFGIARLLDASTLTVTGTTLGTAAYMAPEQLEDNQVGPAADVWSLGIVLLECLTGRRVYEGSPGEVVARRLSSPVPLPTDLPVAWKMVLSGMLEHRPDARLGASEVAAIVATSPFKEPWDRSRSPATEGLGTTEAYDLTALAPAAGPTAHQGGGTEIMPPPAAPAAASSSAVRRRWTLAAVGVVVAAGLLTVVLLNLGSGPSLRVPPTQSGRHGTTTTRAPTTTSTLAPTTTTIAPAPTALANLVRDVSSGAAAGAIDQGSAQSVTTQAQQAITDAAAGKAAQAANDLQQVAKKIGDGEHGGKITQAEGTTLQNDLSALAVALGLRAAGTSP